MRRLLCKPDVLEIRRVLQAGIPNYQSPWIPSDLLVTNPITKERELFVAKDQVNPYNSNSEGFSNQGKVVSGTDRAGDKWVITVHGPGYVIVTDTTPNDGVLDDDINTIQLVNTSPKTTYVTGNVIPSNTVQTIGEILFNQLVAVSGVKSIELNGFDLSSAVTPAVTSETGVFLYGGVGTLSFNSIDAQIDTSVNPAPFPIVIGTANTPLKQQPSIYINNITNLVFDSDVDDHSDDADHDAFGEFTINGVLRNFDIVSATQGSVPAGFQFEFPQVGTTGRTAVQATAINKLTVHGSAKNFTVSRAPVPFSSEASGLGYLQEGHVRRQRRRRGHRRARQDRQAHVQEGTGKSGRRVHGASRPHRACCCRRRSTARLRARRAIPPPVSQAVRSEPSSIGKLTVLPANVQVETATEPGLRPARHSGISDLRGRARAYSLTNAVIVTSGSIGNVNVVGTELNSEVKTGFDYTAYVAGLEGTRGASQIAKLKLKGDQINSDTSASFRPANNHYSLRNRHRRAGLDHGPGRRRRLTTRAA